MGAGVEDERRQRSRAAVRFSPSSRRGKNTSRSTFQTISPEERRGVRGHRCDDIVPTWRLHGQRTPASTEVYMVHKKVFFLKEGVIAVDRDG
jgi:hypothetical protein